jgi:Ca2+-binding EF-hand superfamily protein
MSRITSLIVTAALIAGGAASSAALAQASAAPAAEARPSPFEHMLKKMDTNGDGKISLAEFQAAAGARFDAIDTQHTGKITAEQVASSKDGKGHGGRIAEFEIQKFGSDGAITRDQYLAAAQAHFAKLDKNGDGYITADEMPARHWAAPHKEAAAKP